MVNQMEPTIVQIEETSTGDSKNAASVAGEVPFSVIKSILVRLHSAHALARSLISAGIHNTYTFIWLLIEFFTDICFFWVRLLYRWYKSKDPLKEYVQQLENVPNYKEWYAIVSEIDKITNMDLWRQNFILKHYDYILLNERLKHLREARISQNSLLLMSLLRSGLIRNFGGISQKRLFTKSYLGTKIMIEEYIEEVLRCLKYLDESITSSSHDSTFIMNSKQLKIDFFHDARQSFGCTALLLQGGSLFGLCHVGVVRALYFRGLLPRIICGSAVGAAVASLVCTLSNAELIPILVSISDVMKGIDLLNHDVDERYGNVIENVIKKGYSQDILIFLKFVRDTIGDLTFEEAYLKTDKVLNIIVHPKNQAVPSLLNYITSPNVIIWTAIYASIGTGVLSDNVQLYVKDFNNQIVPKTPLNVTFLKPQDVSYLRSYFNSKPAKQSSPKNKDKKDDKEDKYDNHYFQTKETSPYTRLTELFNVNHFIISLARPYLAPLISNDLKHYHSYGEFRYDRNSGSSSSASMVQNGAGSRTPSPKEFGTIVDERYTKDTSSSLLKLVKNLIGMEIQHRLVVMNKLGMLTDVMKRFFIDEKPSSLQALLSIREVTIVPELRYLLKDFGRVFDVHKTMENIPYWVLVGERSVWPLFPMLWTRCAIEFALDDLYNIHRKRNG